MSGYPLPSSVQRCGSDPGVIICSTLPSRLRTLEQRRLYPQQYLVAQKPGWEWVIVISKIRDGHPDGHSWCPVETTVRLVKIPEGKLYRTSRTAKAQLLSEQIARSDMSAARWQRRETHEKSERAIVEQMVSLALNHIESEELAKTMPSAPAARRPRF